MKNTNYEQLIDAFPKARILVIGDVMIDSYLYGKVDRISPEAPVPIVAVSRRENRLGGAANVALNIAMLGGTPYLCSVIGNDSKAESFLDLLISANISTEGIICDETRLTTTKFRVFGNNAQMLRVDEEITTPVENDILVELCDRIKKIIQARKINAIVFQDYDKGVISPSLICFVTELAKKEHIPVAVDPKMRNFFHYKDVALFKPNLKEFSEGLKRSFNLEQIEQFIEEVQKFQLTQNIERCMITLSEHGIFLSHNKQGQMTSMFEKAHKRNIADVSGAGDTVVSVASMCLALEATDQMIVKLSNLAGGIVCQYVGVEPISGDELMRETKLLHI